MMPIPASPYFMHQDLNRQASHHDEYEFGSNIPSAWICRLFWHHHGMLSSPEKLNEAKQLIQSFPGRHEVCTQCHWYMPLCCMHSGPDAEASVHRKRRQIYFRRGVNKPYICKFCHYFHVSELRQWNQHYYIHVNQKSPDH